MSSSPAQEAVKKSGWWPYAGPLAVALVLFLLVGTIFETRIESFLRSFVERQRQRLFSSTNEEQPTDRNTATNPPSPPQAPMRTRVVPPQTKYSPSQTVVSFDPREAFNLEQPHILITKDKLLVAGKFRTKNNEDDQSLLSKDDEKEEEKNDEVKERDLKKSVVIKAPELAESVLDTKSFRSLSEELMRQKSSEKDDGKLSFFSLSNANVNNIPHYVSKKPDFFNDGGKKSDVSDEVGKDTRYRKRSEMTLMATNLYS